MKIKKDHFEFLKKTIDNYIEENGGIESFIEKYESGDFINSHKVRNINTRFRMDMLYLSGCTSFVCKVLYDYCNDNHVETALKAILPTIEKKY